MISPSEKIYGLRGAVFQSFVQGLLKKSGLKKKYVEAMTDPTGMALYSRAFTHQSIHSEQNYEFLEILGDVTCNKIVVWYIKDRFPVLQNTAGVKVIARLRINLVSKKNFSLLAEKLGFDDFISCEKEIKEQKGKALLEDTFEAFFGATEMLLDSLVHPGAGYGICFKILKSIFDELPISLKYEDLYDPITRLKETFDFYRSNLPGRQCPLLWGSMLFENTMSCVMLIKRLNLGFLNRVMIRFRSARIPSRLFGFFTSINTRGRPLMSRVISGRNSSPSFLQVNSVTTWNLFRLKSSKSIILSPEVSVILS